MLRVLVLAALSAVVASSSAWAQDPVKVDPKHYTVVSENDQVRIVRIQFGPHEKSVMHEHPDNAAVFLTDIHARDTTPDGKVAEERRKKGEALWNPAGKHLPENMSSQPFELILVELKATRPSGKPTQ